MIELKNIGFKYKNNVEILKNINLEIKDGEIVCIIGKNGAGKSTISKIISGILKPTSGSVIIDGFDANKKKNFKEIRKKIGIVFQNPDNQILFNNVYDDLEFSLKNLELNNIDIRIKESLKKVDMEGFEQMDTFKLSLGQKQRINIAGAISTDPKYIILDEPTTMIDSKGKEKIYDIIKRLKENKNTIIFVTNNVNEILLADKIIIMENKTLKSILTKEELLKNVGILEEAGISIPDIIKLILILNENGFDINMQNYTIEELADKILKATKIY
jgi:energy-coupling factor transport system ATP-binding protein